MRRSSAFILIVCLLAIAACGRPAATPEPVVQASKLTPTLALIAVPSATPTVRPTAPPSPTATTAPRTTPTAVPSPTTPTQIAAPTAAPSPLPTPAPAASVTGDSINVRGGPGTVYPVVGQAKKGEALPVVSRTQEGAWLEVMLADGKSGWVSAGVVALNVTVESLPIVKVIPPTPAQLPTIAPTTSSKAQSGATGKIVGRVLGSSGEPRAGERVLLMTVSGKEPLKNLEVYTASDGRFVIVEAPAGPSYIHMLMVGSPSKALLVRVNGQPSFKIEPGQTLDLANVNVAW